MPKIPLHIVPLYRPYTVLTTNEFVKKNTVHAINTLSCTDINVSDVLKVFVTVQRQPPKCYAFYTCFLKFCLALNSYKLSI